MGCFCSADVRQLLHNKFVVVLGDSIQRSVYKDLVKLLQDDKYLSEAQLKRKGEMTFMNDTLVEGGTLNEMHNGTTYREVRQYRTGHHLVRFYFLTRVYSAYMESILSDFKSGPQPDVVIVSSCIWDLMRYDDRRLEAYKSNLDVMFQRLKEVLSPQCLIIWNMTMPVGFRPHEMPKHTTHNLRLDIVEGNFFSSTLANYHKLDVLDMHYHFRFNLRLRCRDAVHWNQLAHRKYTQILLTHIAQAWGVEAPKGKVLAGSTVQAVPLPSVALRKAPKLHAPVQERERCSQGKIPLLPTPKGIVMGSPSTGQRMICAGSTVWGQLQQLTVPSSVSAGPAYMPGYISFDGSPFPAVSPFVTDSPLLTANMKPGYFNPPGSALMTPTFGGRNFLLPNVPAPMNFTPFSNHVSHPQTYWSMKMTSRRALKPNEGWIHPYSRPPIYLPGIN